jgi:RloB-like protein
MQSTNRLSRLIEIKKYILCEGETEQVYFQNLLNILYPTIASQFEIKTCKELGGNTDTPSLYAKALELSQLSSCFLVFDHDGEKESLLSIIHYTHGLVPNLKIGFTNPCFEYWLYLYKDHLELTTIDEYQCRRKVEITTKPHKVVNTKTEELLSALEGFKGYKKSPLALRKFSKKYTWLYEQNNIKKALDRAKERYETHTLDGRSAYSKNSIPITTIHHLIEALETLELETPKL